MILYVDLLFFVCCWAPGLYLCEYVCDISISFYERNLLLHKVTTIFTISYKCGEFDLICVKLRSCKSSYELFLNANKTARSLNRNYNENSNMKNVIRMYLNERSIKKIIINVSEIVLFLLIVLHNNTYNLSPIKMMVN